MSTTFTFTVPTPTGLQNFSLETGTSLLFVGANGSGKTRLAVKIEQSIGLKAHRISAHRALNLNPTVAKISQEEALNRLRLGSSSNKNANSAYRESNRWGGNSSVLLLNDFDRLIQALFAEQTNTSLQSHKKARAGDTSAVETTKFEKLEEIWEKLLPERTLEITGDNIKVSAVGSTESYKAHDMSDGERAIFYLIGQTLCADENSVIIFDEPELHIHKSIMSSLWDELEAVRPDCGFIFISHDLEFVASRVGQKYVIQKYNPTTILPPLVTPIANDTADRSVKTPGTWTIEDVPEETGFSEEITTQILGSRRPILFIEGTLSSLDYAIYRNCYPTWTVIPCNSCEDVIHSVVTMRSHTALTRITCSGIVDADDYSTEDISKMNELGVQVLTVSEIENLLLLPDIATAIGRYEGHDQDELNQRLQAIWEEVIGNIQHSNNLDNCITRYCRRRIDRILKKIDLSNAVTVDDLAAKYTRKVGVLDIQAIAEERLTAINEAIGNHNVPVLMALYDNKGLTDIVARHMKGTRKPALESWIIRILRNNLAPEITSAFIAALPVIAPR
jgi:ABC-type cobalamin/Fe3+-siderophores transport system ATPase subunit